MRIEQLYDEVAKTYNQDLSGEVLDKAKNKALDLILAQNRSFRSILALGMGDGADVLPYVEHYPEADLHGLDISQKMLEKAESVLNCKIYHADILKASSIIEKQDFALILAHFVAAYVPLPAMLIECKKLISAGGLISIVTNTMASFPEAQSILSSLKHSHNPFYKLVAHHIHKSLKKVYVPQNLDHLQKMLEASGLRLVALETTKINISLPSEKDIFDFFVKGGWFVSGFIHPFLPHKLILRICQQLIHKKCTLPYEDSMEIAYALCETAQ